MGLGLFPADAFFAQVDAVVGIMLVDIPFWKNLLRELRIPAIVCDV